MKVTKQKTITVAALLISLLALFGQAQVWKATEFKGPQKAFEIILRECYPNYCENAPVLFDQEWQTYNTCNFPETLVGDDTLFQQLEIDEYGREYINYFGEVESIIQKSRLHKYNAKTFQITKNFRDDHIVVEQDGKFWKMELGCDEPWFYSSATHELNKVLRFEGRRTYTKNDLLTLTRTLIDLAGTHIIISEWFDVLSFDARPGRDSAEDARRTQVMHRRLDEVLAAGSPEAFREIRPPIVTPSDTGFHIKLFVWRASNEVYRVEFTFENNQFNCTSDSAIGIEYRIPRFNF